MANQTRERVMGRKKKVEDSAPAPPGFVTVKLGRIEHSKLRIIAAHQNRDLSVILTEIAREPIDRLWKVALKEQGERIDDEPRK